MKLSKGGHEFRTERFELRLTAQEKADFLGLEKKLGVSRSDIVRQRVLEKGIPKVIDAARMLDQLDAIGAELGRAGNNINQLARHANSFSKRGLLGPDIAHELNLRLMGYIDIQRKLERQIRSLLRKMR